MNHRIVAKAIDFAAVRTEFGLSTSYPAAAAALAANAIDVFAASRADFTATAFVTIDPPGSMDLDQAVYLEKTAAGFRLRYAIADVGAVITPGGALDDEARRRGQTFYLPDGSVPLHPRELSEGSASLLPGQVRPAAVWTLDLDAAAEPVTVRVERALVRSAARLDYAGVQAAADAGTPHPSIAALREFGELRLAAARARGAIELRLPEQDVVAGPGGWQLMTQPRTAADSWNAQVSLLTGMCAARMMIDAKTGLLRTMGPPPDDALAALRRSAHALGVDWAPQASAGEWLAGLDPAAPATLALMSEATGLLRGAGYAAFAGEIPADPGHSAIAAPYAHVTAPLRRLADRFATELCLALSAGAAVPEWVLAALPDIAERMRESDALASTVDRACLNLTEAAVLADRVGERFTAIVLRAGNGRRPAEVYVPEPPVIAACAGDPPEGAQVPVTLSTADVASRTVAFSYSANAAAAR